MWDLWPGITAAIAAFFCLNYFFIPPYGTLLVHQSQDIVALIVFLGLTIIISQLVGRISRNLALARAREGEATRLYELSFALSKLGREEHILHSLLAQYLENQPKPVPRAGGAPKETAPVKSD